MALTGYVKSQRTEAIELEVAGAANTIQNRARALEEGISVCHACLDQMGGAIPQASDPGIKGDGALATLDRAQNGLNLLLERMRFVVDQVGQI